MSSQILAFPAGASDENIRKYLAEHNLRGGYMPAKYFRWPCKNTECPDCADQWVSDADQTSYAQNIYARQTSRTDAELKVRDLTTETNLHRTQLQDLLKAHGDVFMSRWKKRSRDKREDLLRRAMQPHLPWDGLALHYDLTQPKWTEYDWTESRTPAFRQALLLPYLSISNLREHPPLLFALMHHRAKYEPETWAAFDSYQFQDAWKIGLIERDFAEQCVVMHGSRYGQLVPFDADAAHVGDIVGYPRASLILEAQSTLMKFLCEIIRATLDGASLAAPSSDKWSVMCHEGFKTSGDLARWSTYIYQPFSAPPVLDFNLLLATAQLQYDATADHLALLQTDPAYVRRYIRMASQGESAKKSGYDSFVVVDQSICLDVTSLYWWMCIIEEVKHVQDEHRKAVGNMQRGLPLPKEYDNALASLELVLVNQMNVRGRLLKQSIIQRPGFAHHFAFGPLRNGAIQYSRSQSSRTNDYQEDPLFWCVMNLTARPDEQECVSHAHLFTFLETHLAKCSMAERLRLDQVLVDQLSDHAAVHQMLLAVRLNRPQNKPGNSFEMAKTETRRAWRHGYDGHITAGSVGGSPVARGLLLKRLHQLDPPGTKSSVGWVEQHSKVHDALSAYWAALRKSAPVHMGDPELAAALQIDTSPEHLAALQSDRQSVVCEAERRERFYEAAPNSLLDHSSPSSASVKPPKFKNKNKKKTRPVLPEVEPGSADPTSHDDTKTLTTVVPIASKPFIEPPRVSTTKRAVDLFSKMYPTDATAATQSADWDAFVLAMRDIGFVVQNGAGSAVAFEHPGQGKIVFHRPHPVAKIDPVMLRVFGKQLTKWFGWARGSFEVA